MTANDITPSDLSLYRRARFGDAGRCGRLGVAAAGQAHDVGVRAWYLYESGARRPKAVQLRKIARWLTRQDAKEAKLAELNANSGAISVTSD